MTVKVDYLAVGRRKREQRDALIPSKWRLSEKSRQTVPLTSIPETCGILSSREVVITSRYDAVELLAKIQAKELSAEETTLAFCKRAAIAQQVTNCITEIFFDQALTRARSLDAEQAAHPERPLRPLHGLPISLKDSFRIPGLDSTVGLICYANRPDTKYSELPQLLLDLGAVLYCKTNVPQTMMTADSDNNVFGRTLNPANTSLTAGGSTGGEGALIAMRGSVLGVGTDVAGSIRIPSICNGIYGFKPSVDMIPWGDQADVAPTGIPGISPSAGPLATSIRSCAFFMETIMRADAWRYDASCLHLRWNGAMVPPRLRVGVVYNDGMFTPWPPVRRALTESVAKLVKAGVEIVPISLPHVPEAVSTTYQLYSVDGCKFVRDLMAAGNEPPVQSVKNVDLASIPAVDMPGLIALNAKRIQIQQAYRKLWLDNNLDAIVSPGAPTTATPLDKWDSITYTMLWNFMDYPSCIMPVDHIRSSDVVDGVKHAVNGERDEHNYLMYTGPEDYANAALSVQVIGMRQEDERLARIACYFDSILQAQTTSTHTSSML